MTILLIYLPAFLVLLTVLVFYGIEALRGKPLAENVQLLGVRIRLVSLSAFMLFVTVNDLANLPIFEFFKSLVT